MKKPNIVLVSNPKELEDAMSIRSNVFQKEQGIASELDFDGKDITALNFVVYDDVPIATARVRFPDGPTVAKIERVAVLSEHRGKNIGKKIMDFIDEHLNSLGVKEAFLDSQEKAKGFYEKLGYKQEGEIFEEAGIPHVKMVKRFGK